MYVPWTYSDDRTLNRRPQKYKSPALVWQKMQPKKPAVPNPAKEKKPAEEKKPADLIELQKLSLTGTNSSALAPTDSVGSSLPPGLTNLQRFMKLVAPTVRVHRVPKSRTRENEAVKEIFFYLDDLWDSIQEGSAYGVGVPLFKTNGASFKQFYGPTLSGIQLYVDPNVSSTDSKKRAMKGKNLASSDEPWGRNSPGSTKVKDLVSSHEPQGRNSPGLGKGKDLVSSHEPQGKKSPGSLMFEFLDHESPHNRLPIYDKVMNLAAKFPELKKYRSCDLLPTSWICVAWYPIYRMPVESLRPAPEPAFLTFHGLSTQSLSGKKVNNSKLVLPIFGLAHYKLRGSDLSPQGPQQWQHAKSLFMAAETWLRSLQVDLPDLRYFISQNLKVQGR